MDPSSGAALQTPAQEAAAGTDVHNQPGDGAVRFRHDPRLVLSTRVYLTNDQVGVPVGWDRQGRRICCKPYVQKKRVCGGDCVCACL